MKSMQWLNNWEVIKFIPERDIKDFNPILSQYDFILWTSSSHSRQSNLTLYALGNQPPLFLFNPSRPASILNRPLACIVRDRKSTRLNSSHSGESRMPSSA